MAQNLKNLRKTAGVMSNSIIPDTDNAYDIGSAEDKIRDIYVDEGSLWVGDQTGVGSSGGKIKFKNRKATAPIRIETITSGAQRTFTAKLSSADAVNAQRFHDEFDGQLAGVTYEIENLAKTEKDTFALVSYTAEDTTTPGGPYPANVVLDPDTTAGETIFAAHSAGDQYNIFMNMNAVATNRADGKLALQSIEGPGGGTNFQDLFDPTTGRLHIAKLEVPAEEGQVLKGGPSGGLEWGKHHGDGSIPQDNNKAPNAPGTPGELAIGQTGPDWFLYVCVLPNTWATIRMADLGGGAFGGAASGYRSFAVTKGGTNQTGIANNVATKVTWPTEEWDTGDVFASDRFTCDTPGKYHFYTAVSFTALALHDHELRLYKNGSLFRYTNYFIAYDAGANTGKPTMQLEANLDLSVGDYVEVYVHQESGTDTINGATTSTWFTGYRIE